MKRFYKEATATEDGRIVLDGKPVKTPSRADLAAPTPELAEAIAAEWNAQEGTIDPRTMPMTGLANAAIDRIAPDKDAYARGLAVFGESDLLCYRAEAPAKLAARQAEAWDPILAWARRRYDVDFEVVPGVVHRRQPRDTVDQLTQAVLARDPFALAGLSPLVTVGGSLIVALALAEGAIGLETAWEAAMLDELWQIEQWGDDDEAVRALALRRHDFAAGYRFLAFLGTSVLGS